MGACIVGFTSGAEMVPALCPHQHLGNGERVGGWGRCLHCLNQGPAQASDKKTSFLPSDASSLPCFPHHLLCLSPPFLQAMALPEAGAFQPLVCTLASL